MDVIRFSQRLFRCIFFRDRPTVGAAVALVLTSTWILAWNVSVHVFAQFGFLHLLWIAGPVLLAWGALATAYGALLTLLFLFSVFRGEFQMRRRLAVPLAFLSAASGLFQAVALLLAAKRRHNRRLASLCMGMLACSAGGGIALAAARRTDRPGMFWLAVALVAAALFLHLAILRRFGRDERGHRAAITALAAILALGIASHPGFHAGRLERRVESARSALAARLGIFPGPATEDDVALPADLPNALVKAARKDLPRSGAQGRGLTEEAVAAFDDWSSRHREFLDWLNAHTGDETNVRWHCPAPRSDDPPVIDSHVLAFTTVLFCLQERGRVAIAREDTDTFRDSAKRLATLSRAFSHPTSSWDTAGGLAALSQLVGLLANGLPLLDDADFAWAEQVAAEHENGGRNQLRSFLVAAFLHDMRSFDPLGDHVRRHLLANLVDAATFRYAWAGDELRYLEVWRKTIDLLLPFTAEDVPCPDSRFFQGLHRQNKHHILPLGNCLLARISVFSMEGCRGAEWMVENTLVWPRLLAGILRAGMAVERFRRAHGTLPASLEELVPGFLSAMPVDPRTGQAFLYETGDFDDPKTGEAVHGYLIEAPDPYRPRPTPRRRSSHDAYQVFPVEPMPNVPPVEP